MKKVLVLFLAMVMIFALSACGESTNDNIVDNSADNNTNEITSNDTTNDSEWRQFLKDYEAWVDEYIEITKEYQKNPSDMSILSDYTKLVSEMADWTERADDIQAELTDTSEALEYSSELLRIADKLAEVAE